MKLKILNEKDSFALNLQRDEVLDESAGHVILKGAHAIDPTLGEIVAIILLTYGITSFSLYLIYKIKRHFQTNMII